ncbi:Internalin-A precursor [Symmachiella dynata]|uniref:Internalin-A n=1 Tax=Symmachiella dynata TaxID=2527995 RepID=A0A517ZML0_9PLAN|nr:leucine-rich repeat domain-containing protein [Symmachiella dynata]QDU43722.1 Internalin-A precursor [Symmachiella dynata]
MTDSAQKSRLPRTGILVLIAGVLLIGGGALMVWLPYHREQRVSAEFQGLGGTTGARIFRPAWIPDAVSDEYLTVFERVSIVDLSETHGSDLRLVQLRGLTMLKVLDLLGTQVSDSELEHLRGLTNLENLQLRYTQVSDAGLEHLRGQKNLAYLALGDTQISDAGLGHLRGLTNLQHLALDNTKISDVGLEHLRGLTNLGYLFVEDTYVTQAGVDKLQKALPDCRISWTQSSE